MNKANTAEEILDEIIPHDQHCPRCDFEDEFIKAMKEHTAQTLDRLQGKIERFNEGAFISREFVLQLIEEVSDE